MGSSGSVTDRSIVRTPPTCLMTSWHGGRSFPQIGFAASLKIMEMTQVFMYGFWQCCCLTALERCPSLTTPTIGKKRISPPPRSSLSRTAADNDVSALQNLQKYTPRITHNTSCPTSAASRQSPESLAVVAQTGFVIADCYPSNVATNVSI